MLQMLIYWPWKAFSLSSSEMAFRGHSRSPESSTFDRSQNTWIVMSLIHNSPVLYRFVIGDMRYVGLNKLRFSTSFCCRSKIAVIFYFSTQFRMTALVSHHNHSREKRGVSILPFNVDSLTYSSVSDSLRRVTSVTYVTYVAHIAQWKCTALYASRGKNWPFADRTKWAV